MRSTIVTILIFAALFTALPLSPLSAQILIKGKEYFLKGDYERAIEALEGPRQSAETLLWLSHAIAETGDLRRALREITARRGWENFLPLVNRVGELEFALSNYAKARHAFQQALAKDSTYLEARLNLGEMEAEWGNRRQARRLLQYFVDLYRITPYPDARLSYTTARACIYLNRFQDANDLFLDASRQMSDDWRVFVRWGNLFLDKYNFADALATFKDALKLNPKAADALIGIARVNEQNDPEKNVALVHDLLEKFPNRLDVHLYAAHWYLETGEREKAKKEIDTVLKIAPRNLEALTLQAKWHLLEKNQSDFESVAHKVLKINPAYSRLYTSAGDLLARRYLFVEAIENYRRALELNSEDAAALAGLGTTLSRLARLDEALPALEKAFDLDPYNIWTKNLLDLFDSYKDYEALKTEHFLIRLHKDDAQVVGPYATELAEKAYAAMVPRYGVQIDFPVTIEIFPRHDDFAVRCFGLPGAQAFLGVCFGPLITMNSPRARTVGTFNWSETLWHEFAHVIHLTLTNNRVPRWLAEGIAVYEAARANRAWDMNFHLAMIKALERDKIIPLKALDSGFVGDPTRVTFSYYQSSQMVRFIESRFGFSKVLALLEAFKNGADTPEAVKSALGISSDEFDVVFKKYLQDTFVRDTVELSWEAENLPRDPKARTEALEKIVANKPNNYFAHLALGNSLLLQNAYRRAAEALEKAKALFPEDVSEESPYVRLSEAYLALGDTVKALDNLRAYLSRNGKNYRLSLQMYELARAVGATRLAVQALEAAIQISPYNARLHQQLGELYLAHEEPERAIREFEIELALKPADRAGAHCRLAEAFLKANNKAEAKRHALLALEIAPTYARAQEILLNAVQ